MRDESNLNNYKEFIHNPNKNKEELEQYQKRVDETHKRLEDMEKVKEELLKTRKPEKITEDKTPDEEDINLYFKQLTDEEQEMYLLEIKAKILRKKLNK